MNALTARVLLRDPATLAALLAPSVCAIAYRGFRGAKTSETFAILDVILVVAAATAVASFIAFRLASPSDRTGSPLSLFIAPRHPWRLIADWIAASVIIGVLSVLPIVPFLTILRWPESALLSLGAISLFFGAGFAIVLATSTAPDTSGIGGAIGSAGLFLVLTFGAADSALSTGNFLAMGGAYIVATFAIWAFAQRRLRRLCASCG